jgi:hypothetical protein
VTNQHLPFEIISSTVLTSSPPITRTLKAEDEPGDGQAEQQYPSDTLSSRAHSRSTPPVQVMRLSSPTASEKSVELRPS